MGVGEQQREAREDKGTGRKRSSEGENMPWEDEDGDSSEGTDQGGNGPPNDPSGGHGAASGDEPWDDIKRGFTHSGWSVQKDSDDYLEFSSDEFVATVKFKKSNIKDPKDVIENAIVRGEDDEGLKEEQQEQIKEEVADESTHEDSESDYEVAAQRVSSEVQHDLAESNTNRISIPSNQDGLGIPQMLSDSNRLTVFGSLLLLAAVLGLFISSRTFEMSRTGNLVTSGSMVVVAIIALLFMHYQDTKGTY